MCFAKNNLSEKRERDSQSQFWNSQSPKLKTKVWVVPFLFTCKEVKTFGLDRLRPVLVKTMLLLRMVAMDNNIGSLPTYIGTPKIQLNLS